ncbi:MAG: hypothetical protein H6Q72_2547 [Firmicutes bacterium]|nr:hypothetical protein [Bacillota bacterium]
MGQWERAKEYLNHKMQILEEIAANTEAQCRLIQARKMQGLNRVLAKRAVLLQTLKTINGELAGDSDWKNMPQLAAMMQNNANMQRRVMARSREVLQQAVTEKTRIAAELRSSKIQRQVQNQYIAPWTIMLRGCRFNKKG